MRAVRSRQIGRSSEMPGVTTRTHRRRSPIESMVDQACDVRSDWVQLYITYRCSTCGKTHKTKACEDYPDHTAVIEFACQDCDPDFQSEVRYFDANHGLIAAQIS